MRKKKRLKRLMSVPRCGRPTTVATAPAPTPLQAQAWRLCPRTVRQAALIRQNSQLLLQRLSARTLQMVSLSFRHSFSQSFVWSITVLLSFIHPPPHSCAHSLTHSPAHSLTHSPTHTRSLTHSLAHSLVLLVVFEQC